MMVATGIELPISSATSEFIIGTIGLSLSCLLTFAAAYRLFRFLKCYAWNLKEVLRDPFGRKRLAIHLLILAGALFVVPLYALLVAGGHVCTGILALQRFQFLCTLAALGLVLSDWRIDVYEAPLLRARRLFVYGARDIATASLITLAFCLNIAGPLFCVSKHWAESDVYSGQSKQAYVIDTVYLAQVLCALVLMMSMLYSGLQMKTRLVWASRSPLRQNDLFRVALYQLNTLLIVCMASFIAQVLTLLFNYIQFTIYHRSLVPDVLLWALGAWFPSFGWSISCLYLARKAKRQSFTTTTGATSPRGGRGYQRPLDDEYVQALLSGGHEDDAFLAIANEEEEGEEQEEEGEERDSSQYSVLPVLPSRKEGQEEEDNEQLL